MNPSSKPQSFRDQANESIANFLTSPKNPFLPLTLPLAILAGGRDGLTKKRSLKGGLESTRQVVTPLIKGVELIVKSGKEIGKLAVEPLVQVEREDLMEALRGASNFPLEMGRSAAKIPHNIIDGIKEFRYSIVNIAKGGAKMPSLKDVKGLLGIEASLLKDIFLLPFVSYRNAMAKCAKNTRNGYNRLLNPKKTFDNQEER